jgi:hypothetical protein
MIAEEFFGYLNRYRSEFMKHNECIKNYILMSNRPETAPKLMEPKMHKGIPHTEWHRYAMLWDAIETAWHGEPILPILTDRPIQARNYKVHNFHLQGELIAVISSKAHNGGYVQGNSTEKVTPYIENLFINICQAGYHINYYYLYRFFYLMRDTIDQTYGYSEQTMYRIINAIGSEMQKELDRFIAYKTARRLEEEEGIPVAKVYKNEVLLFYNYQPIKFRVQEGKATIDVIWQMYQIGTNQPTSKYANLAATSQHESVSRAWEDAYMMLKNRSAVGTASTKTSTMLVPPKEKERKWAWE